MVEDSDRLAALSEALGLGPRPEHRLEELFALYDEVDAEIQSSTTGLELPCRSGCSDCCYEAVFLSAPEFLGVASVFLRNRAEPERRTVIQKMRELYIQHRDDIELLETIHPGKERDEVAMRIQFRCPLLSDQEQCSVYAGRELNARTFGLTWDAVRAEPYGCERTHDRLKVLPDSPRPQLFDARKARANLAKRLPGTAFVHVFPWWFNQYERFLR